MSKKKLRVTEKTDKLTKKEIEQGIKEVEIIPKFRHVTCIILRDSKDAIIRYVPYGEEGIFEVKGNTYFLISDGIYLTHNNVLTATYLEGISTPITHKNIKKKTVTRTYIDAEGIEQKATIQIIEGLKYDSKIINVILNRTLAHRFLHVKPDMSMYVVSIMLIASIVIGGITCYFAWKGA